VCVKGGGHRWFSADSATTAIWRCGKCGNTIASVNRPLDRTCARGGRCTWRKQ
jgi:ABC-type ATPase with predicted acetyltransferase domain